MIEVTLYIPTDRREDGFTARSASLPGLPGKGDSIALDGEMYDVQHRAFEEISGRGWAIGIWLSPVKADTNPDT